MIISPQAVAPAPAFRIPDHIILEDFVKDFISWAPISNKSSIKSLAGCYPLSGPLTKVKRP